MPYPPKDGGSIATFHHINAFSKLGHHVAVLAMNTAKHYYDLKQLPDEIKKLAFFMAVEVDNRINKKDALLNLFTNRSYNIERFISEEYKQTLIKLLKKKEFDIIQLEGLYLSPYVETIRSYSKSKIVMRAHNIEHEIWEMMAANQKLGLKKIYLNLLSKRLKKYEISRLNKYDLIIPITERDAKKLESFQEHTLFFPSPAGVDTEKLQPYEDDQEYYSLFHIGALDWLPNQEGLQWLIKIVWKNTLF